MTIRVPVLCAVLAAFACDPSEPERATPRGLEAPPPAPDDDEAADDGGGVGGLACSTCHSSWTPNCMTCHMDFDFAQTVPEVWAAHADAPDEAIPELVVDPVKWAAWLAAEPDDVEARAGCPAAAP
jgi:hypothetical protein